MPENNQSSPANSGVSASLSAGQALPLFGKTGRPSVFSREDMNRLVTAINSYIRLKVSILPSTSADGTIQPNTGELKLSDDGALLVLYLAQGGAGGAQTTPMTVVTEHDNYIACTDPNGNAVNVAKPYELRRDIYDGSSATYVDGTHIYDYVAVNQRTNTVSSVVYPELIWLPYAAGEILYCDQPVGGIATVADDGTTALSLLWRDTNEAGRQWGTEFIVCQVVSGTPTNFHQIFVGSIPYPIP